MTRMRTADSEELLYFVILLNHMVEKLVKNWIVEAIARIFYIAGLTMLIPSLLLLSQPKVFVSTVALAGLLILVGYFILYTYYDSRRKAVHAMGWMTLFPALLAVFFAIFGEAWLAQLPYVQTAEPLIQKFILSSVPTAWVWVVLYGVIGFWLVRQR